MPRPQTVDCYDYPQYWDIAFQDETELECDFLDDIAPRYAEGPVRRVLEIGCGGGRNIVELAKRGYETLGLDLSEPSIRYLKQRLRRGKRSAEVWVGDMRDFHLETPADAVLNTFNTFRHLLSEADAEAHFRCVSEALRPGGLFLLGFHLIPLDADTECTERWTNQYRGTQVTVTLKVAQFERRRRLERLRFNLLVRRGEEVTRLKSEYDYRLYTHDQFRNLLAKFPELELCQVYDFHYDADDPVDFDRELSDAVFVLRKR